MFSRFAPERNARPSDDARRLLERTVATRHARVIAYTSDSSLAGAAKSTAVL